MYGENERFRYDSTIEAYSGILSYEEAYDWYADYVRTGDVQAANHQVKLKAADFDDDANQGISITAGIKSRETSARFVKAYC